MIETVLEKDKRYIRQALTDELGTLISVRTDESMRLHTSLHMGGPADVYVEPEDPETLSRVLVLLGRAGFPSFPLGGGTNLLVRDGGLEGVTINLSRITGMTLRREEDDSVVVYAGAGMGLQRVLGLCRREGWSGLESLAGIPGQLGGAVAGNAGSFGGEIKDALASIDIVTSNGDFRTLMREDVVFGYRRSDIPEGAFIVGVMFRLKKDDRESVAGRMDECLSRKRDTQPLGEWSAGCVYRNPQGDSAGRLIDAADCKGMREGDVVVSQKHANFFVNTGNATAGDFLRLMQRVEKKVRERFGVFLEPEIRMVGR